MKIDGLSVVETIASVEQSMPQQNISEDFKVKVENLILLARIMKDRLTTNSTNSSKWIGSLVFELFCFRDAIGKFTQRNPQVSCKRSLGEYIRDLLFGAYVLDGSAIVIQKPFKEPI